MATKTNPIAKVSNQQITESALISRNLRTPITLITLKTESALISRDLMTLLTASISREALNNLISFITLITLISLKP